MKKIIITIALLASLTYCIVNTFNNVTKNHSTATSEAISLIKKSR